MYNPLCNLNIVFNGKVENVEVSLNQVYRFREDKRIQIICKTILDRNNDAAEADCAIWGNE